MMLDNFLLNFHRDKIQKVLALGIFLLYIPFGLFCYFNEFSLLKTMLVLLVLHLISIIPLQSILNKKNNWERNKRFGPYQYLHILHPKMFKLFSLGIVYPYVFIFIILYIRYTNLGNGVKINISFEFLLIIIALLVILLTKFHIFLPTISNFLAIKKYFWHKTSELFYIINLCLLQNYLFFLLCLKLQKIRFYYWRIIDLKCEVYYNFDLKKDFSIFRKSLSFIVNNNSSYTYVLFFILFLEVLTINQIYYFYYFLYLYFIFYLLWQVFYYLGRVTLSMDCCLSDYVYRNFSNPRYPYELLGYAERPTLFFNFSLRLNLKDIEALKRIHSLRENNALKKRLFCDSELQHRRAKRLFDKVNNKKYPLYFRIAAYYYSLCFRRA